MAIVDEWLDTEFEGGRHQRRIDMLDEMQCFRTETEKANHGTEDFAEAQEKLALAEKDRYNDEEKKEKNGKSIGIRSSVNSAQGYSYEKTETNNKEFRELAKEIVTLMGYEATRNLPLMDVEIQTPICTTTQKMLKGEDIAIVPILRAGLICR